MKLLGAPLPGVPCPERGRWPWEPVSGGVGRSGRARQRLRLDHAQRFVEKPPHRLGRAARIQQRGPRRRSRSMRVASHCLAELVREGVGTQGSGRDLPTRVPRRNAASAQPCRREATRRRRGARGQRAFEALRARQTAALGRLAFLLLKHGRALWARPGPDWLGAFVRSVADLLAALPRFDRGRAWVTALEATAELETDLVIEALRATRPTREGVVVRFLRHHPARARGRRGAPTARGRLAVPVLERSARGGAGARPRRGLPAGLPTRSRYGTNL